MIQETYRAAPDACQYREFPVDANAAGQRLDNFVLGRLKGVPKSLVYRLIRKGAIRVNAGRAGPDHRLEQGDLVRVAPVRMAARKQPVITEALGRKSREAAVLLEDDDLLVMDKPAGIAVHGGSGLGAGLIEALRLQRPELQHLELVHRLDRATSGVLMLAKNRTTLRTLHAAFAGSDTVRKDYLALVMGGLDDVLDIDSALSKGPDGVEVVADEAGKVSRSRLSPIKSYEGATLVNIRLFTGRTHQARVHAASVGHPVGGDRRYGDRSFNSLLNGIGLDRLFLHAARLDFIHPASGVKRTVNSPLPKDLSALLARLESGRDSGHGHRRKQ